MILDVVQDTHTNQDLIVQIIVIISSILLLLVVAFIILFPIIKKKYLYKNFKIVYYKKIKDICDKNDYLLLNNIKVKDKDIDVCRIDHIIFANKYIYVIKDRYYRGAINGQRSDNIWLFFDHDNRKYEIHNPLNINKERIQKLCEITGMDTSLFVSIVLVNNDCILKNYKDLNSKRNFIVSTKNLPKLIKEIERRDVKDLDRELVELSVQDIYKTFGQGKVEELDEEEEL